MAQGAVKHLSHAPNSVEFWIQDVFAPSSHSWLHVLQTLWTCKPLSGAPNQLKPHFQSCCDHEWTHPSHHTPWDRIPHCAAWHTPQSLNCCRNHWWGQSTQGEHYILCQALNHFLFLQPRGNTMAPFLKPAKLAPGKERIDEENLCKPCYY